MAAVGLAAFAGSLAYGFVWDDHEQIVNNEALRSGESLGDFWTSDVLGTTRQTGERSNYYRPLFFTSYWVMFQLFELDAWAWHSVALALHLLACLTALWLLRRLEVRPEVALLAVMLFAVHPVHTESVGWLAAAFNDPPVAILLMLALGAHLGWARRRSHGCLAAAALCLAAALAIKESALSFLFLVPSIEAFGLDEPWRRRVAGYATLIATAGIGLGLETVGWLTAASAGQVFALQLATCLGCALVLYRRWNLAEAPAWAVYMTVVLIYFLARRVFLDTTLGVYGAKVDAMTLLATWPELLVYYLRFVVWPVGLSPSYPLRYAETGDGLAVVACLLALGIATYGVWRLARRHSVAGFGAAWFVACLLPALNTLAFREEYLVHHRYLYLAILGPCLVASWAIGRSPPRYRVALAVLLVGGCAVATGVQNHHWRSDRSLWLRVASIDPANAAAFDWLGDDALRSGRIDEAEDWMRRSVATAPRSGRGAFNLGTFLLVQRSDPDSALDWLGAAMRHLDRTHPEENEIYLRGATNYALALAQRGERERAAEMFTELAGPPHYRPDAARNAAVLWVGLGRADLAASVLDAVLRVHPDHAVLRTLSASLADRRGLER